MRYILLFFLSLSFACDAQIPVVATVSNRTSTPAPTPSAFDDVDVWVDVGHISGSSGSYVLEDQSGNNNDFTQAAGTLTLGTGVNSLPKFTGNSTARLESSYSMASWPKTVVFILKRTADATVGMVGHTGASPFNTDWFGYETVNRFAVYNSNSTLNTTAETANVGCYVSMTGHGFRVSILNGDILPVMTRSTLVGPSTANASIGTQYRGLNGDFYECLIWDRVLSWEELDEVHTYINTKYSLTIPMFNDLTPVKTIIIAGQSNAAGRGRRGTSDANVPVEYAGALTGVNVWHGTLTNNIGNAFETLDITDNNHMLGDASNASTRFGPELTLGKEYIDRAGGEVYLFKYALGGTNMAYNASLSFWIPNVYTTRAQNSQNRMFGQFMENWWQSLRIHQDNGRRPNILLFDWFQGEQDATTEADAEALSANTQLMFSTIKEEMAVNTDFKIIICRIHINGSETYETEVRAQQADAAANIPNAELLDTDPYATIPGDGVHLDYQGQLNLGDDVQLEIP